jgi:hypothetical protein
MTLARLAPSKYRAPSKPGLTKLASCRSFSLSPPFKSQLIEPGLQSLWPTRTPDSHRPFIAHSAQLKLELEQFRSRALALHEQKKVFALKFAPAEAARDVDGLLRSEVLFSVEHLAHHDRFHPQMLRVPGSECGKCQWAEVIHFNSLRSYLTKTLMF